MHGGMLFFGESSGHGDIGTDGRDERFILESNDTFKDHGKVAVAGNVPVEESVGSRRRTHVPSAKVLFPFVIGPEPRSIQGIGNVGVEADGIETIEVSVLEHMSLLDPVLVIGRGELDVLVAVLMLDAHEHVEELGATLSKSVLSIGLEEGQGDKGPGLVAGLSICGCDIGKLAKGLADVLLLLDGGVAQGSGKLFELKMVQCIYMLVGKAKRRSFPTKINNENLPPS